MKWVYGYLAGGAAFLILDALWLYMALPRFYRPALGELLSDEVNYPAAAVFYLLYLAGVLFLAVQPALKMPSFAMACLYGAALGLIAYGTYDLTNLASLKQWSAKVTIIDMAWGTILTSVASATAFLTISASKS
jgi:uncharacterized membrane protein